MGIFDNIKAGGDIKISGVNINNGMGVLEQIDEIIKKEIRGKNNNVILTLEINDDSYCLNHLEQENSGDHGECFKTKKEMTAWLNENGWNIKEKHGS